MSIYSVSYPLLNIQSKMMLWFLVLPFDILFLIPWIILDLQRYGEISKILVFNFKHSKGRSVVISLEVLGNYKIFNFIFIQYVQTKFLLNSKTIVTYNCFLLSKTIVILKLRGHVFFIDTQQKNAATFFFGKCYLWCLVATCCNFRIL